MGWIIGWALFSAALLLTIIPHELGHLVAAKLMGMKVKIFQIGVPTIVKFNVGYTEIRLGPLFLLGGVEPENFEGFHWAKRLFVVGVAPVVSILLGTAILLFALSFSGPLDKLIVFEKHLRLLPEIREIVGSDLKSFAVLSVITLNKVGPLSLLFWAGLISAVSGFTNLIPVPVMDGGRLVLTIAEGLLGRKVQVVATPLYEISGKLVLAAMIFYVVHDLFREDIIKLVHLVLNST